MKKRQEKKPHVGEKLLRTAAICHTDHRLTSVLAEQFLQLLQKSYWRKDTLKKLVFHSIKVLVRYNTYWGKVCILKTFEQFCL